MIDAKDREVVVRGTAILVSGIVALTIAFVLIVMLAFMAGSAVAVFRWAGGF